MHGLWSRGFNQMLCCSSRISILMAWEPWQTKFTVSSFSEIFTIMGHFLCNWLWNQQLWPVANKNIWNCLLWHRQVIIISGAIYLTHFFFLAHTIIYWYVAGWQFHHQEALLFHISLCLLRFNLNAWLYKSAVPGTCYFQIFQILHNSAADRPTDFSCQTWQETLGFTCPNWNFVVQRNACTQPWLDVK